MFCFTPTPDGRPSYCTPAIASSATMAATVGYRGLHSHTRLRTRYPLSRMPPLRN